MSDYDSALAVLRPRVARAPDSPDLLSALGLACAGAGRFEEAIASSERAVSLRPIATDAFGGPYLVETLAEVYLAAGRKDRALDQLQILLGTNHPVSKTTLRFDNTWAPLRNDERFRHLTE
jgi:uncharacterized protein HemY